MFDTSLISLYIFVVCLKVNWFVRFFYFTSRLKVKINKCYRYTNSLLFIVQGVHYFLGTRNQPEKIKVQEVLILYFHNMFYSDFLKRSVLSIRPFLLLFHLKNLWVFFNIKLMYTNARVVNFFGCRLIFSYDG